MAQVCNKCSRANPDEASYCYFDGVVLGVSGANGGPLRTGMQTFPTPFVFTSGRTCRTFDQLAIAFQERWSEATELLHEGFVEAFLGGLGRIDLATAAKEAARFPDRDRGLDQLLAKLPSDVIEPPKLDVEPTEVNLGQLAVGEDRQLDLHLSNRGMRLLYGAATCADCVWLALGDAPGAPQKLFQFDSEFVVPLHVRGKHLRAGNKPVEGCIAIESNGGSVKIRVRADIPVKPFPNGILAGAKSPREVAAKARAHPKEAAVFFENGAVANWYETNGWTYPVQGPAASGQGAVQQFFEALGLTRPPKVEINARSIALQGSVGERVQRLLEVKTVENRPVYAHAVSDQPWLEVGQVKLKGRIATIPVVVPTIPNGGGETLQAKVTVTSNGNQTFEVPVTLAIANCFTFDSTPPPELNVKAPPPELPLELEPEPPQLNEEEDKEERLGIVAEIPPPEPAQKTAMPPAPPARPFRLPKASLKHVMPAALLACALLVVVFLDIFGSGSSSAPLLDSNPRIAVIFHKELIRFGIAMPQEPDPDKPGEFKRLTNHKDGATNNTCLRIGDRESLFGLVPGQWLSDKNHFWKLVELQKDCCWKSIWEFPDENIQVTQLVKIVAGEQTNLLDTCLVKYELVNGDDKNHSVGLRVMLDTFIGANDGVPFLIPGESALLETGGDFGREKIPDFIQAQERADPKNPGTVAVIGLKLRDSEPIDQLIICPWPGNKQIRWQMPTKPINEALDLGASTIGLLCSPMAQAPLLAASALLPGRAVNEGPKIEDSCVVLYWDQKEMKPRDRRQMAFTYGLDSVSSTTGQMGLSTHGSTQPDGVFWITAYVKEPTQGRKLKLALPPELTLVSGEREEKTIAHVEPGKNAQVSWKVNAPTKKGEYSVTVTYGQVKEEVKVRIINKSRYY